MVESKPACDSCGLEHLAGRFCPLMILPKNRTTRALFSGAACGYPGRYRPARLNSRSDRLLSEAETAG